MDDKLNIRSLAPIFGSKIKVKGLGPKKQEVRDRSFEKHLKKDRDKKKKESLEATDGNKIDPNKKREVNDVDSNMNESSRHKNKYKQIDVLA